eukprot:g6553.t1
MGQICPGNKNVAPMEPLDDDGDYVWCDDLDSFMQVFMIQGDIFGIPAEAGIEMASRGLLDCPFENEKQKESWYIFRNKLWEVCSSADSSKPATISTENSEEGKFKLPYLTVKKFVEIYLGHSPYLLMRANQFMVKKYGEDVVYGNDRIADDTASVEEDYNNIDIIKSEDDLGI